MNGPDPLHTLTRYKAWANALIYGALAELPEAELTRPRQILFGNMLRTLNHVYLMDVAWKAHLEGVPHGMTTRNPESSPPFAQVRQAQQDIDAWYQAYADALQDGAGDEIVEFAFIGGGAGAMRRRDIVLHVVNHGTYHRGHVAAMMYQVPCFPPASDLPVYLAQAGAAR
ncbi:DinB family protein [Luteimonas aquatica]|uniref:DinB family protein n=1 Tax=Luteimonas aquatica TaxID=450364 RepID=UPI001F5A1D2A|nr:DinB family protein [Luteimonas aquatica]